MQTMNSIFSSRMNTRSLKIPMKLNLPSRRVFSPLLLALFCSTVALSVHAADANPPAKMSYRGFLVDGNGVPLGNDNPQNFDVVFRVYNASQGGDIRWAEQQTITVDKGNFSVFLGEGSAVGSEPNPPLVEAFAGVDVSERFIGITVQGLGGEIAPRLQFLSSPFSFLAKNATALVGSNGQPLITGANGTIQSAGGNPRGIGAVDLQTVRFEPAQVASGAKSVVSGGENNLSSGVHSTVSGGFANLASGINSTVSGGASNQALGLNSVVAGGADNEARSIGSAVIGGAGNIAENNDSLVGGGFQNQATGLQSVVAGGNLNKATADYSTVAGGSKNTSDFAGSFVGGGTDNRAGGDFNSSVVGGFQNVASGLESFVGGGARNQTTGVNATVAGGDGNTATGSTSVVGGGHLNTASGINSAVLGGYSNLAQGGHSFAAGRRAKAYHTGSFVWADTLDADFGSTGDNQFVIRATGGVGINGDTSRAMLNVHGNKNTAHQGYYFMARTGFADFPTHDSAFYSIWASDRIACFEFNAFSDARAKSIIGRSNREEDLESLMAIGVTDYTFKDTIARGTQVHKKVIAQQVNQVYPSAVSKGTDVVPDIYKRADRIGPWIQLETDLKKGDRVRLVTTGGPRVFGVLEADGERFRVDLDGENEPVFVYGREVDDFLSVDYDAIAMLNVSATQKLYELIQEQRERIERQDATIRELKAGKNQEIAELRDELRSLKGLVEGLVGGDDALVANE